MTDILIALKANDEVFILFGNRIDISKFSNTRLQPKKGKWDGVP